MNLAEGSFWLEADEKIKNNHGAGPDMSGAVDYS